MRCSERHSHIVTHRVRFRVAHLSPEHKLYSLFFFCTDLLSHRQLRMNSSRLKSVTRRLKHDSALFFSLSRSPSLFVFCNDVAPQSHSFRYHTDSFLSIYIFAPMEFEQIERKSDDKMNEKKTLEHLNEFALNRFATECFNCARSTESNKYDSMKYLIWITVSP